MNAFAYGKRLAVIALVIPIAWILAAPLQFRDWHSPRIGTPQDHGLHFEPVELHPPDQPITIRAWWLPAPRPKAALVMVHGGGDNRSHPYTGWLDLARDLVAAGYSVMDVDLRNHGESDDSAEGATFGDAEAYDVIGAVDFLKGRDPGVRVGAIGYSMGGQTVLYAASRDARIEAVVEDGTYAEIRPIVPRFGKAASGLPALFFSEPFLWSAVHVHGIHLDRARAAEVIGSIAPRPVLLIHDEADPIVPVADARRLAASHPTAELWVTSAAASRVALPELRGPWGTHCQSYKMFPEEYARRVVGFFDRVFTAPAAEEQSS